MGFSKYQNYPIRRIDIIYVPYESYYSALIYFTGPADFNRSLRLKAKKLGYKLNQYGLYKNGKRIFVKSEDDIIEKINK
jgi:DNA polymerase/3'-5' exonuclease PolX